MPPSLEKQNTIDDVYRSPNSDPTVVSNEHAVEENYNMIDWFKKCLRNYTNFSGRARRKEYWYFALANWLIGVIAMIVDAIIFDTPTGLFYAVAVLGLLIPGLAVLSRRLHDTGRSAWWFLIVLVPLLGSIALIVFLATETKFERNKWGAPAK